MERIPLMQDSQIAHVMPDFLPGVVTGVLLQACAREMIRCCPVTIALHGSRHASSVSLQVNR